MKKISIYNKSRSIGIRSYSEWEVLYCIDFIKIRRQAVGYVLIEKSTKKSFYIEFNFIILL